MVVVKALLKKVVELRLVGRRVSVDCACEGRSGYRANKEKEVNYERSSQGGPTARLYLE